MKGLSGKKVFIAGGTGGIGKAIAEAFVAEGANIFIQGRDALKFGNLPGIAADLSKTGKAGEVVSAAAGYLKGIDIFVSAIGNGKFEKTGMLSQEEWNVVMGQNFFSTALLIKEVVPHLAKGLNPNIVVIGSLAGLERMSAPVGYTVSKAALHAYVRAMSDELAEQSIRINIVHPGNVYFEGSRWEELKGENPEKVNKYITDNVPLKVFGKPGDVAQAVIFLSSAESGFITGTALEVDGGQHRKF